MPEGGFPEKPDDVDALWLDVGFVKGVDFQAAGLAADPPVAAPDAQILLRGSVIARGEATGGGKLQAQAALTLENDPEPGRGPDRRGVELSPDDPALAIDFNRKVPPAERTALGILAIQPAHPAR